ncbi:hypothetical protein H2200_011568 [Cladophialophora chaetospira]|uniref:Uncharacterized protein n=1 Tax=Cladophialophora chaetospira TaxID=386627 RepID=A0AA38WZK8_9EURO|nr:hypothetical protein H2200_011568 [Cladophialophora chaetospira]
MAARYAVRELYGGAMKVELPVELIDSSDIRQVPDHQEVFLSPTTLTSIIFEINTYVLPRGGNSDAPQTHSTDPTTTSVSQDGITTTTTTTTSVTTTSSTFLSSGSSATHPPTSSPPQETLDADAAKFHFTDVIAPPDSLVDGPLSPQPIRMADPSLSPFPAYMLAGNINTIDPRHPGGPAPQPITGSSATHASAPLASLVHQLQLLIRLQQYGTDLVVRVAIPLKEFAEAGRRLGSGSSDSGGSAADSMIAEEMGWARDLVARVVGTLGVRDWGLFGS